MLSFDIYRHLPCLHLDERILGLRRIDFEFEKRTIANLSASYESFGGPPEQREEAEGGRSLPPDAEDYHVISPLERLVRAEAAKAQRLAYWKGFLAVGSLASLGTIVGLLRFTPFKGRELWTRATLGSLVIGGGLGNYTGDQLGRASYFKVIEHIPLEIRMKAATMKGYRCLYHSNVKDPLREIFMNYTLGEMIVNEKGILVPKRK